MTVTVGVLALQGAFREHASHINRLASSSSSSSTAAPLDVHAILVRTPTELATCDALIIPGGESTAIALSAQRGGLMEPLRAWVAAGRPTWGTCAGMIMLSNQAIGAKRGGQSLIGGVDIRVGRNGFGSQVDSFEAHLDVPALGPEPFPGVFIRAPVIDSLLLLPNDAGSSSSKHPRSPSSELPGINGAAVPVPASLSDVPPQPLGSSALLASAAAASTLTPSSSANGRRPGAEVVPLIVYAEPPSTPIFEASQAHAELRAGTSAGDSAGAVTLTTRPPLEIIATIPFSPTMPPKENVEIPQSSASPLASDLVKGPLLDAAAAAPYSSAAQLRNPEKRPESDSQIVALRQGRILVTSFHPELTVDSRFHEYFVRHVVLQ
ncbi:Senecionine N-oxygenase [Tilletia horrida]|uniref:glutaminase n=1 Tax=Tilletia horrida TaxID=155126 RepID=A0AAN6JHA3_9BASI|nr:Senecionine N-oxygenase [Tilletia horrida]